MKGITFIQPLFVQVVNKKKDMTRRVALLPFALDCNNHEAYEGKKFFGKPTKLTINEDNMIACKYCNQIGMFEVKPRYRKGEVVYLKEPYMVLSCIPKGNKFVCDVKYKFTNGKRKITIEQEYTGVVNKWKSPRFMPEWASRYKIEVTNVGIQHLDEINNEDSLREGVESIIPRLKAKSVKNNVPKLALGYSTDTFYRDYTSMNSEAKNKKYPTFRFKSPKDSFKSLWNAINGKKPYHSNPYVFVYTFKLC